ncbi:MAG: CbiX/SirB N-terminal domain-containing protein [Candidatus Hydrogenedentes bacterium]|nr:CbiX/SirB N-terminal domain-containing protein [Candidatus Hydrogenedentota bacterium]
MCTFRTTPRVQQFRRAASVLLLLLASLFVWSAGVREASAGEQAVSRKAGVLLVNHGSRSETWRNQLLQLEKNVAGDILKSGEVQGIKTAFMEYTEPSIATRLKEFDQEAYTDVVIVPIFLTVSPHSFEDIPTIIGQKEDPNSMEMLKLEHIERYTPSAKTHLTPLLDFTDALQKNVLRRVKSLSKNPEKEGLVLIGYGDETYEEEWGQLFGKVAEFVKKNVGIDEYTYGWCGHIAGYNPGETTAAVKRVLETKEVAVVVPVLVAHDENFQIKIIGGGIEKVENNREAVLYRPDAILPDPGIEHWVTKTALDRVKRILAGSV